LPGRRNATFQRVLNSWANANIKSRKTLEISKGGHFPFLQNTEFTKAKCLTAFAADFPGNPVEAMAPRNDHAAKCFEDGHYRFFWGAVIFSKQQTV
jgi:hypothetical protein